MNRTLLLLAVVIGYIAHWVTIIAGVFALVLMVMGVFGDTDWWFASFGWSIPTSLIAAMVMVTSMQAQFQLKKRLT